MRHPLPHANPHMTTAIPWLSPEDPFPPPSSSWDAHSPMPGLLAAGGVLDVPHLLAAYRQGIFPWFGEGQPILWWSTTPRMVLPVAEFRLHHVLRKTIRRLRRAGTDEIRIDSDFSAVIHACASMPRTGQSGTWIVPEMVRAYEALHAAGHAHSVENWVDGRLAGGLYCVAIGRAVFGESMFAHVRDASKIALAALVALCRGQGVALIDCQQNTAHLASLGAREVKRDAFLAHVARACTEPALDWRFAPQCWDALVQPDTAP